MKIDGSETHTSCIFRTVINMLNSAYLYIVLVYYGSFKDQFKEEMFESDSEDDDDVFNLCTCKKKKGYASVKTKTFYE